MPETLTDIREHMNLNKMKDLRDIKFDLKLINTCMPVDTCTYENEII